MVGVNRLLPYYSIILQNKEKNVVVTIQNSAIEIDEVSRLYPAAIIRYADGTVTPISLEWFDQMANDDVMLLHYAICFHYKDEEREPDIFTYETKDDLEEAIASLSMQLNG